MTPEAARALQEANRKTILLMEDHEALRIGTDMLLKQNNYTVLLAEHGRQGVELSRNHKGTIDLILSDIQMPYIAGPDAVEIIRSERPGVPVIYVTGIIKDPRLKEKIRGEVLLEKPYGIDALLSNIRQKLGEE